MESSQYGLTRYRNVQTDREWDLSHGEAGYTFAYSADGKGEHPQRHLREFAGVLQADGYSGFSKLYDGGRVLEAACWAHVRRKFVDLHELHKSPVAAQALDRIGALYAVEKDIRGRPPDERRTVRQERSRPSPTDPIGDMFKYSYRADGARSSLVAATNPGGTFSWTYTNAGRMLTQSDPLTGQPANSALGTTFAPNTFTYDSYGQVSSFTVPGGYASSGFSYDAAGKMLGYTFSSPGGAKTMPVTQTYSVRGELVNTQGFPPAVGAALPPNAFPYANGAQCSTGPTACTYDARSGSLLSSTMSGANYSHMYTYDTAGRQIRDVGSGTACGTVTRNYDADNHIIQQAGVIWTNKAAPQRKAPLRTPGGPTVM